MAVAKRRRLASLGKYENILDRCFGPDPDPVGKLPTMPYMGSVSATHEHTWSTGERHGVPYWECAGCSAVRSQPPPEEA